MNEKGLVVNMLALVEPDYGKPPESKKVISNSTWAQYILDNHAAVAEAVAELRKEEFQVQTVVLPTGNAANMHLAISDSTGDSAVFEYVVHPTKARGVEGMDFGGLAPMSNGAKNNGPDGEVPARA